MTTQPSCDTCKYWDFEDILKSDYSIENFKVCHKPSLVYYGTEYNTKKEISEVNDKHKNDMMFTQDADSYKADFYTRHDFFCAQFEAKT